MDSARGNIVRLGAAVAASKLLIVDDDGAIREELSEHLTAKGYACATAPSTGAALEILRRDPGIGIILSDLKMPGQNGLELLAEIKGEPDGDREVIILTGHGDKIDALRALRLGVRDFLEKPIDLRHLLHTIQRTDEALHLRRSQRLSHESLQAEVETRTLQIRSLVMSLEEAYVESLECLAMAAEYKDPETGQHIRRIGAYARFIAAQLGWSEERQQRIELAARLHDVGKIGTPDKILLKQGKLSRAERAVMQHHSEIGGAILSRFSDDVMKCAANIGYSHHERWDGSGYPAGLRRKEITVEARITALADVYDALRSSRPYKPAFDHDKAVTTILKGDGRTMPEHFDPELLDLFRGHEEQFAKIYDEMADQEVSQTDPNSSPATESA